MSINWKFSTIGQAFSGRINCWPLKPGTFSITASFGGITKILTDDGNGLLIGDGTGTIDYDYGHFGIDFSVPVPPAGTELKATYEPVEGGCLELCGKCATHYLRLEITPGDISGSDDYTISDAWQRLFVKLERDVKPIHVEFMPEIIGEHLVVNIGRRFDIIPADIEPVDSSLGIMVILDETLW